MTPGIEGVNSEPWGSHMTTVEKKPMPLCKSMDESAEIDAGVRQIPRHASIFGK